MITVIDDKIHFDDQIVGTIMPDLPPSLRYHLEKTLETTGFYETCDECGKITVED